MGRLIERDEELARMREVLAGTAAGRGRAVMVGGEAGIGKTSLASAFAEMAHRAGATAAIGRCDALVTPRALGPFVDIAAQLGLPTCADRDELLERLLDRARHGGATFLAVEDAHWADDASLELVGLLARRTIELPLVLVVTYREEGLVAEHPLTRVLGDLATTHGTTWLHLAPLSPSGVDRLSAERGRPLPDLHAVTGGNPFFVTEVLAATNDTVPPTVRLAVLARIHRLPAECRGVLDAVAVVPGRAEPWLVEALCPGAARPLAACVRAGVLLTVDGKYAFRHELARRAVEMDIADDRRRALHRQAIAVMRERSGVDPARLAHHAFAAGDDEALAVFGAAACQLAHARSAHREAVRHGERALSVADALSPRRRADVELVLARSLFASDRTEDAVTLAAKLVAYWREEADARQEAQALDVLASALAGTGAIAEATDAATRAVSVLEGLPPTPELAVACARMTSLHMLAREHAAAAHWGRRTVALAERLGDDNSLARALIDHGIADVMAGNFAALDRIHRGIEIAERRDFAGLVALGWVQIGSGCGELRRYELAVPALRTCIDVSTARNIEYNRRYAWAWLARCQFDQGDWAEAELSAHEALAGPRSMATAVFVALTTLGWLRARRGQEDVWPALDEALRIARRTGHLQRLWPVAVARAEAGWLEGAIEPHVGLLDEVLELAVARRHGMAVGEVATWRRRAGATDRPALAAEPFAALLDDAPKDAAVGFGALGCPYEQAMSLYDAGAHDDALVIFESLGAQPMIERLRPGSAAAPPTPCPLTARELDVLRLVAAGLTNPQIAAALYISRKTAAHHVSSILMKLGVATRAEAAAEAVRQGLADR